MKCDIGHFEIKAEGRCYNLIPSFENIMKLGDGEELIDIYNTLHGIAEAPEHPDILHDFNMYLVGLSAEVIRSCADIDPSLLLVDVVDRNGKFKLKLGSGKKLTPERQIILAAGLVRHGVAGVNPESKSKSKGKAATSIDIWDYVNTARVHLEITRNEALSLTMTEFAKMMNIKFPPEKTAVDVISDDEYDEAMSRLAAINKIRDVH
ncbi:hypothetical protein NVP1076O_46 [Vibrio phage 1.076.O._10N.286.51.B7]|nr:hypothetical protein NVP1076O_46 [Vibrio phage 1.076.O._10N.286.51.B7]